MNKNAVSWKEWKRQLVVPSKNSYVYKLGYRHAILWYQRHSDIEQHFATMFGPAARSYYYKSWGNTVQIKQIFQPFENRRWFYGSQRWGEDRISNKCFWAVFKTDQDRTLALLTL
jgi:hypothetical protein